MNAKYASQKERGFSLIEVLIALAILSIALTALLKATAESTRHIEHLKSKTIAHWVMQQEISKLQMHLISAPWMQETTGTTEMLGQKWYWKLSLAPSKLSGVEMIRIQASRHETGPFTEELLAFKPKQGE